MANPAAQGHAGLLLLPLHISNRIFWRGDTSPPSIYLLPPYTCEWFLHSSPALSPLACLWDRLPRSVQCLCVSVLRPHSFHSKPCFPKLLWGAPPSEGLFQIFYNTVWYICQSAFFSGTPAILVDVLKICVHWSSFPIWDVQSSDFGQIHRVMCPPPRQLAPSGTLQCWMPCCLFSHKDIVGF